MKTVTRYLGAPARPIQIMIWVMLAAVLGFAVPAAMDPVTPDAVMSAAYEQDMTQVLASSDTLVLADAPPAADATASEGFETTNPNELLPAYRWRSSMNLHSDLGAADIEAGAVSQLAQLSFAIANLVWWLLLQLMNFAMSLDIVNSFSHTINNFFATTYEGLYNAGVPLMIGIVAAAMGAMAALRQKLGQGMKMVLSAFLVLGMMQALGTAAGADSESTAETAGSGYSAPAGTPAWFAVTGNEYVNQISYTTSSVFGATAGITETIRTGSAGPSDAGSGGPTCAYYNQRLYSTYNSAMLNQGGVSQSTGAAMSMVSFMWQRSMYDNYTLANFGNLTDGSRVTCHLLERNRNVPSDVQASIAGTGVTGSPYAGMGEGPFKEVTDHDKHNQAAALAWAACTTENGAGVPNGDWDFDGKGTNDGACGRWFSSDDAGGLNSSGNDALSWRNLGELDTDTKADYSDINSMVRAFYGHNSSQRFLAGGSALATAALYGYAFAGPAVGVLLSQFVLLFMLILLPWTLLVLALPDKNGGRNSTGRKLLRLTGMAFGGKVLFLAVMGVTLTIMSALFSITMQQPELTTYTGSSAAGGVAADGTYTMWSILVPAVTIVVVRMVLKGVGMGNLMGLGGAMGFATAAVTQGKDGAGVKKGLSQFKGGKLSATVKKGTGELGKRFGAKAIGRNIGARMGAAAIAGNPGNQLSNGTKPLQDDLARKVASGQMSVFEANRHQRLREKGLSNGLAARVANGELTRGAAKQLQKAETVRRQAQLLERAQRAAETPDETSRRLAALAAGAPLSSTSADPHAGFVPGVTSAGEVEAANRLVKAAADISTSSLDVGSEHWKAAQIGHLGQTFEAYSAVGRVDGMTGSLTPEQVAQSRSGAQSRLPAELASSVIVGDSGAPPLLLPSYHSDGRLVMPASALQSPEIAAQILSNPLNMLPPEMLALQAGETPNAHHTRLTMALLEHDLATADGARVDVLAELGVDRADGDWQARVIELAQANQAAPLEQLVNIRRTSTAASTARINAATEVVLTTTPQRYAEHATEAITVAAAAAADYREQAQNAVRDLQAQLANVDISVLDSKKAASVKTEILKIAEQQAESLMRQMSNSRAELQFLAETAGDLEPNQDACTRLKAQLKQVESGAVDFRHELAKDIVSVINAPVDSKEELASLTATITSKLSDLSSSLERTAAQSVTKGQIAILNATVQTSTMGSPRLPAERLNITTA